MALRERVQRAMSRHVAVVREATGLREAAAEIDGAMSELASGQGHGRVEWETSNLVLAARGVVSAALLREESRGAHYRSDFPAREDALDGCHLIYGGASGAVWRFGTLAEARAATPEVYSR